ncbi:MAG: thiolase family protein [Clostridiales Family XIII bacterium]|nr:thiolase family protein [Clostridiales Family XIII bacterium]
MNKNNIVMIGAARTPFGRYGGSLKDADVYDLGAITMREVVRRAHADPTAVREVFWGMGDNSSCKDVVTSIAARQSLLKAGLSEETNSCSLDKACVSGTSAIIYAIRGLKLGESKLSVAGGVQSFSQVPYIARNMRFDKRIGNRLLEDPLFEAGYKDFNPVSADAGDRAIANGITREMQDRWAVRSHERYGEALAANKFVDEIIPYECAAKKGEEPKLLTYDEQYRKDVTYEKLSKLPTIYGSKTVTAGNAPGLNDGSAAVLLTTEAYAEEIGVDRSLCAIVDSVSMCARPDCIADVPGWAILRLLEKTGLSLDDIKLIEINEAFAVMPLLSLKHVADEKGVKLETLYDATNVNGGAIAIGHANCATGARLVLTLANELRRRGGGYGIAAICGGLAQGDAILIKVE